MLKDKFSNRIQFEIGIRFDLVPNEDITWKDWFFNVEGHFTRIGDQVGRPTKKKLPKMGAAFCDAVQTETGWEYFSRCFWLAGAIRVFGLDVGIGFFYRKEYQDEISNRN